MLGWEKHGPLDSAVPQSQLDASKLSDKEDLELYKP